MEKFRIRNHAIENISLPEWISVTASTVADYVEVSVQDNIEIEYLYDEYNVYSIISLSHDKDAYSNSYCEFYDKSSWKKLAVAVLSKEGIEAIKFFS